MGSILKRGNIYYIRYDLPPTADGTRRERMKSCKSLTKGLTDRQARKAAELELARIEREIRIGSHVDPSSATLSEYLETWIHDTGRDDGASNTHYAERMYIRCHINPQLGGYQLARLTPMHVQEFYNTLGRKGARRDGGALAPKSIRNIHALLNTALKQAVRWRLIERNPAEGLSLPKVPRPRRRSATLAELATILNAVEKSRYRIPILIAIWTGMRRGEVLALRWEDFETITEFGPELNVLWVRRALAYAPGAGVWEKETKTAAGERAVLIGDTLAAELKEHRKAQLCRSSDPKDLFSDRGYICAGPHGDPITPAALGCAFTRLASNAGVILSIHELRHTQATQLIRAGVLDKTVADRLGHANAGFTKNVYTHTDLEMQRQAVQVLDALMRKAMGGDAE